MTESCPAGEQQLTAPYRYLEQIPGKDMRRRHIEAFNSVIGAPDAIVQHVVELVQTLHNVSLLLDDIEDGAVLRRGRPVANSIFGAPRTINAANFVMLRAIRDATSTLGPEAATILYEELFALHHGQGLDLYWRDAHVCPTIDEYVDMVRNKTGGLYRLPVRLLQLFGTSDATLAPLANMLGVIYQIQDDYLNLSGYEKNKGFCEDITEGKYSFPVVHFLSQSADETRSRRCELDNILRLHTADIELKQYALSILQESGSLEFARDAVYEYASQAKKEIEQLKLANPEALYVLLDKLLLIPSPAAAP